MTRIISLVVAVAPLLFVFFVPEILKLSFFTRAFRLSISIVALIGLYLPTPPCCGRAPVTRRG